MEEQMELSFAHDELSVQSVYDTFRPHIDMVLSKFNFSSSHIVATKVAEGLSIRYNIAQSIFSKPKGDNAEANGVRVIFKLSQKSKTLRIEIPIDRAHFYECDALSFVETKAKAIKERKIDVSSNNLDSLRQAIINDISDYLLSYPADFACCSLYEQCSNAGRCVQANQDMAASCSYKKNLMQGRIFYGNHAACKKEGESL